MLADILPIFSPIRYFLDPRRYFADTDIINSGQNDDQYPICFLLYVEIQKCQYHVDPKEPFPLVSRNNQKGSRQDEFKMP